MGAQGPGALQVPKEHVSEGVRDDISFDSFKLMFLIFDLLFLLKCLFNMLYFYVCASRGRVFQRGCRRERKTRQCRLQRSERYILFMLRMVDYC